MKAIGFCSCGKLWENPDTKLCASCSAEHRKATRIKLQSDPKGERTRYEHKYKRRRKQWVVGKKCQGKFPHDCYRELTCHHMAGRSIHEFHDEWAQENDVPLLIDERLWMPLCLNAHSYVTEHSKWAWENGYSFKRVSDPIFQKQNS